MILNTLIIFSQIFRHVTFSQKLKYLFQMFIMSFTNFRPIWIPITLILLVHFYVVVEKVLNLHKKLVFSFTVLNFHKKQCFSFKGIKRASAILDSQPQRLNDFVTTNTRYCLIQILTFQKIDDAFSMTPCKRSVITWQITFYHYYHKSILWQI